MRDRKRKLKFRLDRHLDRWVESSAVHDRRRGSCRSRSRPRTRASRAPCTDRPGALRGSARAARAAPRARSAGSPRGAAPPPHRPRSSPAHARRRSRSKVRSIRPGGGAARRCPSSVDSSTMPCGTLPPVGIRVSNSSRRFRHRPRAARRAARRDPRRRRRTISAAARGIALVRSRRDRAATDGSSRRSAARLPRAA